MSTSDREYFEKIYKDIFGPKDDNLIDYYINASSYIIKTDEMKELEGKFKRDYNQMFYILTDNLKFNDIKKYKKDKAKVAELYSKILAWCKTLNLSNIQIEGH